MIFAKVFVVIYTSIKWAHLQYQSGIQALLPTANNFLVLAYDTKKET